MSPATRASLSDPPAVPLCGQSSRTVPSDCARQPRRKVPSQPVTVPLIGRLAACGRIPSTLGTGTAARCGQPLEDGRGSSDSDVRRAEVCFTALAPRLVKFC